MLLPVPVLFLALAATPPAACADPGAGTHVLARIGEYSLTCDLFEAFWAALPPARRAGYEREGGKPAFLGDLVDQKLVTGAAERAGFLSRPDLRAAAELARDIVLYRAFIEEKVTKATITEEVKRRWYRDNASRFAIPETVTLRQIVVTPFAERHSLNESGDDATSPEAAQAKVERLRQVLEAGEDFAALARRESEDSTAPRGGLIADIPRGRLAKPLEDAVFALKEGQTSAVLTVPGGLYLLRLEHRRAAHIAPFEDVEQAVGATVAAEREGELRARLQELTRGLRREIPVVMDATALGQAPAPAAGPVSGARP